MFQSGKSVVCRMYKEVKNSHVNYYINPIVKPMIDEFSYFLRFVKFLAKKNYYYTQQV